MAIIEDTREPDMNYCITSPTMEQLSQLLDLIKITVQQGHDPASNYQSRHLEFTESMISTFLNSPTALKYKRAHEIFQKARTILDRYTKAGVDTESDCDFLQPAFQGYSKAYMCDNIWYDKFKPPENAPDLIDQYLKHRPDDVLSEFCKHIIVCRSQQDGSEFSKFKHFQIAIRTYDKFAMQLLKANTTSDIGRKILATLYNRLGSFYTTTLQEIRAIDSFKKSYDFDKDYHDSLFGIAMGYRVVDLEKAISFFHKYLDSAPECDKKYYDAYYLLSNIYISKYGNTKKAKEYYRMGLDAEKKQLPFFLLENTVPKRVAKLKIELSERNEKLFSFIFNNGFLLKSL